jgi:hypothetical protein
MDRCSSFVQLASVKGPATTTAGPLRVSGWTEKGRNHGTETTSLPIIHARTKEGTNERTNASVRPFKRLHRRVLCAGAVDRKKASDFFFFFLSFLLFWGPSSALYFLVFVRNTPRQKINKINNNNIRCFQR